MNHYSEILAATFIPGPSSETSFKRPSTSSSRPTKTDGKNCYDPTPPRSTFLPAVAPWQKLLRICYAEPEKSRFRQQFRAVALLRPSPRGGLF